MRRRLAEQGKKAGILVIACALMSSVGCVQHHYYYTQPGAAGVPTGLAPCDPVVGGGTRVISSNRPIMSSPVVGSICDDPPQGSALAGGSNTPIYSNAGNPIAPEPIYSRPFGRPLRRGGLAWRNNGNTEALAKTRVDGDYSNPDDPVLR